MKTSILSVSICIITTILVTSCSIINRQNGSGNVVKTNHAITGFNKLDVSTIFETVIIPSAEDKVTVEADDNLQKYITIELSDSTLYIKMIKHVNIGSYSSGKIYVYTKGISAITNSSVGKLSNEGTLTADDFTLNNNSVGNNNLKIKAKTIKIDNSAVGKTNLYLESEKLVFSNSAVGKTLLTGSCNEADIDNSGVGSFDAKNYSTQILHIKNSAVGSSDVTAQKEFYINNSGVGRLDVYGTGVIKQLDDSGVSKTRKH